MLQMRNFNHNYSFPASELSALLRKASTLAGAYNTGYTAHYIRLNRLTPTSYSPIPLGETVALSKSNPLEEVR